MTERTMVVDRVEFVRGVPIAVDAKRSEPMVVSAIVRNPRAEEWILFPDDGGLVRVLDYAEVNIFQDEDGILVGVSGWVETTVPMHNVKSVTHRAYILKEAC